MSLHAQLTAAVRSNGNRVAVVEADGTSLDYASLGRLADRCRDRLVAGGIRRGDRVGIYARKSAGVVAAIFGILKSGAAYVPVDPGAPPARNAYIHRDCAVTTTIVERRYLEAYERELAALGGPRVPAIVIEDAGGGAGLDAALAALDRTQAAPETADVATTPDDLAYILYTSGSTGRPKGVMLSHRNGLAFVDWCSVVFQPQADDVFSSHAPFHFDLSILDLFVSLKHGARLVLIPEETGKQPLALSDLISRHRITIWYSAPSILSLLAQFGKLPAHDTSSLRLVLFAGEVMPVVHLRSFQQQVPAPRYFNLYGPTETNVCTYHEIPGSVPDDRVEPYPIGRVCEHLRARVADGDGRAVTPGAEGELCIAGPNVMQGYWNLPQATAAAWWREGDERWYRTGDIVAEDEGGVLRYLGRRDRMIKKRGYRVELGEIEACLYLHEAVREAAVVAVADAMAGVQLQAHLSLRSARRPSLIELKAFCARNLPLYMVPDSFAFHDALPKTSTDKIDYQTLQAQR